MSDYRRPHMSMEFIDASTPRVRFPSTLRLQLVGHLAQVETGAYIGDYDRSADLVAAIPDIMDQATVIPSKVTVKIVLNANGKEEIIPDEDGDNWEVTGDSITIKDGIVVVTSDQTTTPVKAEVEASGAPAYNWRVGASEFQDSSLAVGFSTDTDAKIGDYLMLRQFSLGHPALGFINADTYVNGSIVHVEDGEGNAVTFQFDHGNRPTGFILLTNLPADGNTIVIDDGTGDPAVTYEFDDGLGGGVGAGNVAVLIGLDIPATVANLANAITAQHAAASDVFVVSTPGGGYVYVANNFHSADGDVAIVAVGANITVAGLTGGGVPGTNLTPGYTLVATERDSSDVNDDTLMISNLVDAINASTLEIDALVNGIDPEQADLENKNNSAAGNIDITFTETTVTTFGMLGGADDGVTTTIKRITTVGANLIVEGTLPAAGDKAGGDFDYYKIVARAANGVIDATDMILSDDTVDFSEMELITGYSMVVLYRADGTASDPIYVAIQDDGSLLLLGTFSLPAMMNLQYVDYKIVLPASGKAFVGYYALRGDLNESRIRVTRSNLLDTVGGNQAIVPDNPIAFGTWLALQVAEEVFISCPNESEPEAFVDNSLCDETEWAKTLTYLRTFNRYETAYSFVSLVQNTQINSLLELFVNWMRDPDTARMVCGYGSFPRISENVAVDTQDVPGGQEDNLVFTDITQDFVDSEAIAGGYLELSDADGEVVDQLRIKTVATDALTLYSKTPDVDMTDWTYRVVNAYYTAYDEACLYKAYAEGYANRAFRLVWPHFLKGTYRGATHTVPSYYWQVYWCARLAASNDVGMPHTRAKVNFFFTGIVLPDDGFKDEATLDHLISGGIEAVWQDTENSPLYSIHQVTTDMSSVNTMEQSIVHQFDYAGTVLITNFDSVVGTLKLDAKGMALLNTIYTASRNFIVDKKGALQSLTMIKFQVDEDDRTLILLEVEGLATPPFNGGHIKIYMV